MAKRLSVILESAGIHCDLSVDPDVLDVTEDSRQVEPGWLFVAISGTHDSGSRHVVDAVARGAVAVLCDQTVDVAVPVAVATNTRAALSDVAACIHDYPTERLRCFGVTGTDGKTTTSFLLHAILSSARIQTGLMTTVETRVGGHTLKRQNRLTTPSAPFVQRTLRAMAEAGDTAAVIECSSHALQQERLRNVHLRCAAITNIASDHVEYHGSREAYIRAKARIADLLLPEGSLVVNVHDPDAMDIAQSSGKQCLTFGLSPEADVRATDVVAHLDSLTFTVEYEEKQILASLPMGGSVNVLNALAALALAVGDGIGLEVAVRGLLEATLPPGRLERVDAGQPFSVFVDYAHTEQAFETLLKFARDQTRGSSRVIAVFGAAGDRDREKRPRLAALASRFTDFFVITNEDPFGEPAESIVREIAAGAPLFAQGTQWISELDRKRAIEIAFENAQPGDIVLITGKGHETSIADGDRSQDWSDREVAGELLRAHVGTGSSAE